MTAAVVILLAALLGVGGTVAIDSSKPGDVLFGADQALERLNIALTRESREDSVRLNIAEERVKELDDLAKGRNGALRPEDRSNIKSGLEHAVQTLTELSDRPLKAEDKRRLDDVVVKLNSRIESSNARALAGDDSRFRVEFGDDSGRGSGRGGRLEIETEDGGRIRIDLRGEDDSRTSLTGGATTSSSSRRNGSPSPSSSPRGLTEVEAKIYTDITLVKIELNDNKTIFTTSARTREEIINEILKRVSGLTRAQVETSLFLEVENRASRPEDLTGGGRSPRATDGVRIDDGGRNRGGGEIEAGDDRGGNRGGSGSDDSADDSSGRR